MYVGLKKDKDIIHATDNYICTKHHVYNYIFIEFCHLSVSYVCNKFFLSFAITNELKKWDITYEYICMVIGRLGYYDACFEMCYSVHVLYIIIPYV